MTFIFTGTASGIPVADRRHASLVLAHAGALILFDAGEGVSAALIEQDLDAARITDIFLSHTHSDHVTGLPMLLQGMHLAGRTAPLDIHIPPRRREWFRRWFEGLYILEQKWSFPFSFRLLEKRVAVSGGPEIIPFRNSHLESVRDLAERHAVPAEAFSFRIGSSAGDVVLSSDIAALDDVADAAGRADLLIVDATHVPLGEIGALAERHPGLQVVCTHIPPEMDSASTVFQRSDGRVLAAYDGFRYDLRQKRS